jgi:DeoR/GlpR family transcriptional regulator of sugar metabolism
VYPLVGVLRDLSGRRDEILDGRAGPYLADRSAERDRAVRILRDWKIDVSVLGAEGVTEAGFWNSAPEVVALQKAAMGNSKKSFVLVAAEKIGRRAGALLASWESGLRLITDATPRQLASAQLPQPEKERT